MQFFISALLPDALATACSKCSEKQRNGAIKVIKALEKDHPDEWKKLLNKWDPDGKKMESFKAYVTRWRSVAAQITPEPTEKELMDLFMKTLPPEY